MEYSDKIKNGLRTGLAALSLAAVCSGITYLITSSMAEEKILALQEQISISQQKEKEALVTKRISQQMEEIAYQQKTVSDKQRERAEEQTKIADMERGKALIERGLAQAAERKAVDAAAQADSMRVIAESQTVIAMDNMLAAEKARAQADTLSYISLARSLAQTSLTKSTTEDSDLSRLLAYASWYYTKQYSGEITQQEVYNSIVRASGSFITEGGSFSGNVRVVKNITMNGNQALLAVTDYGEMILWQDDNHKLFNIDDANYRDAVIDQESQLAYLLTSNGYLRVIDFSSAFLMDGNSGIKMKNEIRLPGTLWKKLINDGKGNFIAVGEDIVAWIDSGNFAITNTANVSDISTAGLAEKTLHLFSNDGHHYISEEPGEITPLDLEVVKGRVSDYYYSNEQQYHFLGMDNGTIYVIDCNGKILKELQGHTSGITKMELFKHNILASSSYDRTIRFWQINNSSSVIASFVQTFDRWPLTFDLDRKHRILWTGTQDGYLSHFCVELDQNAKYVRSLLNREFTADEWNYYVGPQIPQIFFLKGGKK